MQTRLGSLLEALANVAIGLAVSLVGNIAYFHATGVAWQGLIWFSGLAVWMTALSIARTYLIRRWNERRYARKLQA